MAERDDAIKLANRVLDKPYIDPDGDICLLARQFLHEVEVTRQHHEDIEKLSGVQSKSRQEKRKPMQTRLTRRFNAAVASGAVLIKGH